MWHITKNKKKSGRNMVNCELTVPDSERAMTQDDERGWEPAKLGARDRWQTAAESGAIASHGWVNRSSDG